MSKKDQPLCEYVCSNLNNTIEIINAMSTEGVDDDEEIILYILNSEQVNEETKEMLLESGRIDHSESDRNSQFELNRNSQCTLAN